MSGKKPRKPRADMQVKTFEKKMGLPEGTIRNPDGRDARGDKTLRAVRKEAAKKGGKKKR